ncbi:MAG TPA: glycosyltransferase, partial [Deltaproteobacteria bacterium]|nr:glycosyltransferase [Deltaproteobacteria bacterium]
MTNLPGDSEPHRLTTSVLITTYNRPDTLIKVLEALCRQTRPADEIIVADDGSGQETLDMIR